MIYDLFFVALFNSFFVSLRSFLSFSQVNNASNKDLERLSLSLLPNHLFALQLKTQSLVLL